MPFCVCTLDSMLILCYIFVELEHIILFNNFDKYNNFIYGKINIKLMVRMKFMSRCSRAASTPYPPPPPFFYAVVAV